MSAKLAAPSKKCNGLYLFCYFVHALVMYVTIIDDKFSDLSTEQAWENIASQLRSASAVVGSVTGPQIADVLEENSTALAEYDFDSLQRSTIDSSMDTFKSLNHKPSVYAKALAAVGLSLAAVWTVAVSGMLTSTAPAVQPAYEQTVSMTLPSTSADGYTKGFSAVSSNYAGADGTFSVSLPDRRTVWVMADTLRPSAPMIHSSVIIQSGSEMTVLPDQLLPSPREGFYWPSGAYLQTVSGHTQLVINAQHVQVKKSESDTLESLNQAAGMDFVRVGSAQFVFSVDVAAPSLDLNLVSSQQLPEKFLVGATFDAPSGVYMLATATSSDPTVIGSDLYLIKAPSASAPVSDWEFKSGERFVSDFKKADPIIEADGFLAADSTPSVYKAKDGWVVVNKNKGALGSDIVGMLFDEQFNLSDVKVLASAKTSATDFTYNAQIHQLPTKSGSKFVLSVDNNTTDVAATPKATSYRPHFYRSAIPKTGSFSPIQK